METNRKQLLDIVRKMSQQERKDWIYEHVYDVRIVIADLTDEEVNDELNSMK